MIQPLPTINLIGCGRVGTTLARLFHERGVATVQDLGARSAPDAQDAARFIGTGRASSDIAAMSAADVWMLTVPDARIAALAADVASARHADSRPAIAFHCSGFHPADVLEPLRAIGWQVASVHPVLSFATPASAVEQFHGTPCGIEGDAGAVERLYALFGAIGAQCFPVVGARKALYHAAAVFANNFTVVLQALAREAWKEAGVPDDLAARIQAALLRATTENVIALGAGAITGPAARGDTDVVRAQAAAVGQWHPEAGEVYRQLSELAHRLASRRTTVPPNPH